MVAAVALDELGLTEEDPCLTLASPRPAETGRPAVTLRRWLWQAALPIALIVLLLGFGAFAPDVLSPTNLINIVQQTSYIALFAMAHRS